MVTSLNFGKSGFVAVQDEDGRELYRASVQTEQEANQWISAHEVSAEGYGILKASFLPVRVDNCADLLNDLFLPTFVNHVLSINRLSLKILAALFALPWDLFTLSFRLIGLLYRLATDEEPQLPVHKLIETSAHFQEVREKGVVRLVAHLEDTHVTETLTQRYPKITGEAGNLPFQATRTLYDLSCEVYLKAFPWNKKGKRASNSLELFMRSFPSGEWNCQDSGSSRKSIEIITG